MYSFESKVRYSEVGEDTRMTLYSVLNYFQDCSVFHSESVGRGTAVQETLGHAWVLTSWQIELKRMPLLGEEIRISTWPHKFRGFLGERNFLLETMDGEMLACADANWAYLDLHMGHPMKIPQEELQVYPLEEKLEMKPMGRKIVIPQEKEQLPTFLVKKYHLDSNHHVNNAQYIRLAQEYLPDGFEVESLRAEYKRQAVLGEMVHPWISKTEDGYVIGLCNKEQEPYAVIAFH